MLNVKINLQNLKLLINSVLSVCLVVVIVAKKYYSHFLLLHSCLYLTDRHYNDNNCNGDKFLMAVIMSYSALSL